MAEILKPSGLNTRWAQGGDILDPGITKYAQGWEVEIPPRQWFNFLDNRQDEAIAHINQHGIAVWDAVTEYQANKSYVQGSNGTVYKALTTNTNINPTTDGGTNWQSLALFPTASTAQAQAWTSDVVLLSPLKLAQAFQGSNQSLTANGYQKIPGDVIIQWGTVTLPTGASTQPCNITFPISFPNSCRSIIASIGIQTTDYDSNPNYRTDRQEVSVGQPSTTGVEGQAFMDNNVNDARLVQWFAIGS